MSSDTATPARGDEGPVLVTGGAGFIGRHLVAALLARGERVRCLDLSPCTVPGVDDRPGDVRDEATVRQALAGCRAVVHLAAVVGVQRYMADPLAVLDTNLLGGRNVLLECKAAGVPVVIGSTSEVHGATTIPLDEGAPATYPEPASARWSYATSKLATEQYAAALARAGLRHATVRFFNVYGPGLDAPGEGRVLSRFIGQLQQGAPLTLVDGGVDVRAFCYVDDAVAGILAVLDHIDGATAGGTWAIGRDEPVDIAELARRVNHFAGREPGDVVHVPSEALYGPACARIRRRVPDVSALREATGFEATVPLDEGLRRSLDAVGLLRRDAAPEHTPLSFVQPQVRPDHRLMGDLGVALTTGAITNMGCHARGLEGALSAHLDHPVQVVASGWAALFAALQLLDRSGPVLLPAYTFAATAHAARLAGHSLRFVDIDPETWTLAPAALEAALVAALAEGPVAAVVAVNAHGVMPDLDRLCAIADAHGVPVVLDNAHGFGTTVRGVAVHPGLSAVAWSLHATKTLPAGEGGVVAFADPALRPALARLRNHGLGGDALGANLKMSELHAAVARHALGDFSERQRARREAAAHLRGSIAALPGAPMTLQRWPDDQVTSAQNLAVLVPDAAACARDLATLGVGSRRYFWPALGPSGGPNQPPLPVTQRVSEHVLCLPLWDHMAGPVRAQIDTALRRWAAGDA